MSNLDVTQLSILVVDDEPANLMLVKYMLELEGYQSVTCSERPVDAMQLLQSKHFDLVLLDLNMPELDGFGVMQRIVEHRINIPVIVLTAQTDNDTRLKALKHGACDFLTKPFLREEVLLRVKNQLQFRLLYNQQIEQNTLLDQLVKEKTTEVVETRLEIIQRLGRAAEYRDNETGNHIIRMSRFSALIARAAGMSEDESELLLHASPMHDLGKIGIPDHILLKPGRFEPHEWEIMKTHSAIGAEILSGHRSELLQKAAEIALAHHEKWDGSGYPNGLAGEDIPLSGRIVALSDVFDALVSERPYKKAWSVEDAVAEIRRSSGTHFEPRLVEAFNECLPDMLKIRDAHQDAGIYEGE